ncbi:MAG: hypothetical protein GY832_20690 [Chloroflexi bacterium]|nr:hypothetical protein [Chloroflexota bacterium]
MTFREKCTCVVIISGVKFTIKNCSHQLIRALPKSIHVNTIWKVFGRSTTHFVRRLEG